MGQSMTTHRLIRCIQSIVAFSFASLFFFLLSLVTYFTLRKHLMPTSHLIVSMPLGFLPSQDSVLVTPPSHLPAYLVSYVNLTHDMHLTSTIDLYQNPYLVELECLLPRSYINRQIGSFIVQFILRSTSNKLLVEHSRSFIFPYESQLIRIIRTLIFLPFSLVHIDLDKWSFKKILISRLIHRDYSQRYVDIVQLNVFPSAFQIEECNIHFHMLDLTGLAYSFIHYPFLTGCLSVFVLFSIYMTFYLIVTGLTLMNQMVKERDDFAIVPEVIENKKLC